MKLSTLSDIMHSLPLLCSRYCHVDHVILICFPATSNLLMRCHVCCIHTHTYTHFQIMGVEGRYQCFAGKCCHHIWGRYLHPACSLDTTLV